MPIRAMRKKYRRLKEIAEREEIAALLRPGAEPVIAVDAGGAGGLTPTHARLRNAGRFLVYEPEETAYAKLVARAEGKPEFSNITYIGQALSGTGGQRTLYVTNTPSGSSLYPPLAEAANDEAVSNYIWPITEVPVETVSLTQSLDAHDIKRIDAIKLDTQGSEHEILFGLDDIRWHDMLCVETEVGILHPYEGSAEALERLLPAMRDKGFTLFDMRMVRSPGNVGRLGENAYGEKFGEPAEMPPNAWRLHEIDALFIREPASVVERSDADLVRRYLAILAAYCFYGEMLFTIKHAVEKKVFSAEEGQQLEATVVRIREAAKTGSSGARRLFRALRGSVWAQYLWSPYPST